MTRSAPATTGLPRPTLTGPGRSGVDLDRTWWSWAGPHGGLVGSLLLGAALDLAGEGRVPRALSVQFLSAPPDGPLDLAAEVLREGGSSSVVQAQVRTPAGPAVTAVLTSARHRPSAGAYGAVPAPVVRGPQDCQELVLPVELVPFTAHVQVRPASAARPLAGGDVAELVAWVRLEGEATYDAAALVVLTDVLPPALYAVATAPVAVPTVDLQVVLTGAPPAGGWVLTRIATRTSQDGWCVDDSEVWDASGRLLVQARQVRRVLGDLA